LSLSGVIKGLGWIFIVGGIVIGVIQGLSYDPLLEALTRWTVALSWMFYGLVSGVLFLAVSQALDYLEVIAHNSSIKTQGIPPSSASPLTSYPTTGKSKPTLESLSKSHTFKSND